LRCLLSTQPATSTGQVVAAWKEIEAALLRGMKIREVWEAAKLDGLDVPYNQFRVYVSRLRRRRLHASGSEPPRPASAGADSSQPTPPLSDPFRNLREEREKKERSGFDFDPFSTNKNLI
jgi:hypothetical protein